MPLAARSNPNADRSADLIAMNGQFVLGINMPTAPTLIERLKAIAHMALPRLEGQMPLLLVPPNGVRRRAKDIGYPWAFT